MSQTKKSLYELQMELEALEAQLTELRPKPSGLGIPRPIPMRFSPVFKGFVIPTSVTGDRLQRVTEYYGWPNK